MSGRVQVFARIRPAKPGESACIHASEQQAALQVLLAQRDAADSAWRQGEAVRTEAQEFVYDGAIPMNGTQQDVFAAVGRPVLDECLKGFNGTIFAYGQTGSGKTHSLLHAGQNTCDAGLLPQITAELFNHISQDTSCNYSIEVAAMQVYNDQVDDLLHHSHKSGSGHDLKVWFSGEVPDLTWIDCTQANQLDLALSRARKNLIYAETKMNKASSRSHAIFQIKLSKVSHASVLESTCSRLTIVDLAGSERVKKSGVRGSHFKEAAAINASLLALGNVVSALAAKKSFVPYRDSRLTHILSPAIGENCKTSLLVCASPAVEHVQETLCSLEFASRAMNIEVNARVNRFVEIQAERLLLQSPTAELVQDGQRDELAQIRQTVAEITTRAEVAEARVTSAEQEVAEWRERAINAEALSSELAHRLKANSESNCVMWQQRHKEASLQISILEDKLAQRSRELEERSAALCSVTTLLQNLQAEMEACEADVLQARRSKVESEQTKIASDKAAENAALLGESLQRAHADAVSKAAAAEEQMARAAHEADQLHAQRVQMQNNNEKRRFEWAGEVEAERHALFLRRESVKKQEEDLARRLALVEDLEKEKRGVERQQKELDKQRVELKLLDRRLRNGFGPHATGPPVTPQTLSPKTPPLLPGSDRGRKSNQTSVFRAASMTALSPTNSPVSAIRSRTPPPSRRCGA